MLCRCHKLNLINIDGVLSRPYYWGPEYVRLILYACLSTTDKLYSNNRRGVRFVNYG